MKKFVFSTILVLAVALIFAACGTASVKGEINQGPSWVRQGLSGFICAVGIGTFDEGDDLGFIRDLSLDSGRLEIAKNVAREYGDLLENYRNKSKIGSKAEFKQSAREITEALTHKTVKMAEQKDMWQADSGNIYTLVCLDPQKFKDTYKGVIENSGLDKEEKDGLKAEAEEMAKMEIGAKNIRRRETSGKRKASAPKPRKIDPDKLKLFNLLTEAVGDFTDGIKCKNEAEFSFSYNGNAYTVKLIKHRPKK